MPITLHDINEIDLNLDFLPQRVQIGETTQFVIKFTATQQKLEDFTASLLLTAQDMNTLAAQLENLDISSAYDVAVLGGYQGTALEWLSTLIGPQGPGGISAYDVAVNFGFVGNEFAWLESLKGQNGVNGIAGDGAGYVSPPWSIFTPAELDAFPVGSTFITDNGRTVALADDAIRFNWGTVADIAARDLIPNPQHGDYVIVTADGGQYHYYSESIGDWVDTGSTVRPVVPAYAQLNPNLPSSSWTEFSNLPSVSTSADLENLNWGDYPNGVYVEDIKQTAYRDNNVNVVYQDLCGTSATAWASRGWVLGACEANQAARVQVEVTADTYARIGFQDGTDENDSLMVEVRNNQIQGYDNFAAVGSAITVSVGDVIGLFRYANGEHRLNINSVDVYTFARSETRAMDIYAYMLGVDDCVRFAMNGVDGNFLNPTQWDGISDAVMSETERLEDFGWTLSNPAAVDAAVDNRIRVVYRTTNQKPELGGSLNKYPAGAVVDVSTLKDTDVFTLIVSPGETASVDGTTITIDAGWVNHEPVHFAKIGANVVRIGANG